MNTQEIFDRTADLLERVGWCRGDAEGCGLGMDADGRLCLLNALGAVVWPMAATQHDAYEELLRRTGASGLAVWNDHPERTHAQVLGVLRLRYRDFEIDYDPVAWSVGALQVWRYTHKNYDGDEDSRIGGEATAWACIQAIDERFYDAEVAS